VRRATGTDLRAGHSGSTGARNAARVAGPRIAVAVFLIDLLKGAAAVVVANASGLSTAATAACALAVVAGHVLPAQLRFRGGRGLSTALGALLVLDPWVALCGVAAAAAVAAITRRFTIAGIGAALAAPVAAWALDAADAELAAVAAIAVLITAAHARR
jgi:acyl phosphate:glycerol-3-phosphate acyltransferase